MIQLRRPRNLGAIMDDTVAVYRAHWRALLAIAVVVVVPVQVIVFGLGLGWLTSGYDSTIPVGATLAGAAAQYFVIMPLVTAMTVDVVTDAADGGGGVSARRSIQAGLDVFARLLVPVALVIAAVISGIAFFVVPGLIFAVRLAVVPQAVVVEDRGGTDALRASWELTAGRGWFAFAVVLVINLLAGILGVALGYPLQLAADAADAQGLYLLGQIIGTVISQPIIAVALTLLYFSLRAEREGAAPRAQPPPPPDEPPRWEPPVKDY